MKKTHTTKKNVKKQTSTKIDVIEKSIAGEMLSRGDLLVAVDEVFGIALVYAYGTFAEFNALREKLFKDTQKLLNAYGYCSTGTLKPLQCPGILVWLNSLSPRKQCFPILIHEISHLADFILENARTDDKSGEARAYLMQREIARVFPAMFGIKCHVPIDATKVEEYLKTKAG